MSQENLAFVIEDRVVVPRAALDHGGYRSWVKSDEYPERLRTAFVSGAVLVEMTPESIHTHNQVKAALTEALNAFARERDLGTVFADGLLVTHERAGLSCEPDLTFVSWAGFEEGRVRLVARVDGRDDIELVGSPDVVVEIVSDSSVRKDGTLLREAYFAAGVAEYWLIDARGDEIRFEILRRGAEAFLSPADPLGPQISACLSDQRGRWHIMRSHNRAGLFAYSVVRVSD